MTSVEAEHEFSPNDFSSAMSVVPSVQQAHVQFSALGNGVLLDLVHKDNLEAVAQPPKLKDNQLVGDSEDKWEQLLPEHSDDEL